MINRQDLNETELILMEQAGVDVDLSLSILNDYNSGKIGQDPPVIPSGVPKIDGEQILDLREPDTFSFTAEQVTLFLEKFPAFKEIPELNEGLSDLILSKNTLSRIGTELFSYYSYGFLNGGSATSYADRKKNREFQPDLFSLYEEIFQTMGEAAKGRPKGVTPAFIQPDGSAGPSYMELKLRSILLCSCKAGAKIPFFQMTSVSNDKDVQETLNSYRESPWLKALANRIDHPVWKGLTGIQPMITAYSHSKEGKEKDIFRGKDPSVLNILALPGGHGQNFRVLKETFRELYQQGIRFVSLGNIDNLGYTPDPLALAILALKGNPAGFDFSFKTAVDVKGGILVRDQKNRLNCVDLGVGISRKEAEDLEKSGSRILFNCATGLFDLTWLIENLDRIIKDLPMRFSDQNKDAGEYSQAEQVTWEVIGMIDNPLIFGIDKYKRFLAAKMLMENLLTSGLELESPSFPGGVTGELGKTGRKLYEGLQYLLTHEYDLVLINGKWQPRELSEKTEKGNK